MQVLIRSKIEILKNTLTDETPRYDKEKSYNIGDRVWIDSVIYECDKISDPPSFDTDFKQIGADNVMSPFDSAINTAGKSKKNIELEFLSTGWLYVANFECDYIIVRGFEGDHCFYNEIFYSYDLQMPNLESYFFATGERLLKQIIIPREGTTKWNLQFCNNKENTSVISVGVIFCGEVVEIGQTLYKGSISLEDFSKVQTDDTGNINILPGLRRKTYKYALLLDLKELDKVLDLLLGLKNTPSIFILSNAYDSLQFFGLLRSLDCSFSDNTHANLDLELEELT
ncbi:hypothetical protein [Helicobacter suis]|uniref:hypothetical protein n=1 Tax=Helicobacter suis TaxID=104628 RepID=UPI0013D7C267|nr:hypothetical protein [Helicobacter suis]